VWVGRGEKAMRVRMCFPNMSRLGELRRMPFCNGMDQRPKAGASKQGLGHLAE
jgi:hypothetical protein